MDRSNELFTKLSQLGVGKRSPHDEFFKFNKIITEMMEHYVIFDIDIGNNQILLTNIACQVPGCSFQFDSVAEFESHYRTAHKYTCQQCKKNLPSAHLLGLHVEENHDSFFAVVSEKKPSYACFVETCKIKFMNIQERLEHCIDHHKFPPNFRFNVTKDVQKLKLVNKKNTKKTENSSKKCEFNNSSKSEKPKNHFYFNNSKSKSFNDKLYISKSTNDKKPKSSLDSENMFEDLKNSLPK